MVAAAVLPGVVMPQVGIAGFLASLSKHQGFRKGIQRAGASRTIRRLVNRLSMGQLTSQDVERAFSRLQAKVLIYHSYMARQY